MGERLGDLVAYFIVLVAVLYWIRRLKLHIKAGQTLSQFLLKQGQVKWAFRIKGLIEKKKSVVKKSSDCH
ncbi:MAG: hypothetical protein EOP09_01745 [Proteobacteria bacterium]|nr:MAG: hypothetical protein EOP09_01745 [Pseudomonadota bacterium]